jgi:hypothetical protein
MRRFNEKGLAHPRTSWLEEELRECVSARWLWSDQTLSASCSATTAVCTAAP